MSDSYTFDPPNDGKYLQALLMLLRAKKESDLYDQLKNSKCGIDPSSSFSGNRWNALSTTIHFYFRAEDFGFLNIDDNSKSRLTGYCDTVMPKNVGFDVVNIEYSPNIGDEFADHHTLEDDLEEFSHSVGITENFHIPEDILAKGKEMMRVYLYLYAIENYMRLFIERVCRATFGQDYFSKLTLTKNIMDMINGRKRTEEKNRWISIRGNSDLFYLDFIELSAIIQNNRDLFKDYFPDQSWISSKLSELYYIRNLVAHNSYVGEHEHDILQVTFRSIVKQLNRM